LEKTEGTPFFMEEVVQELVEQGVLRHEPVVGWIVTHPTTALHLPTTVQGVLAARIDRLAPDEKALLQQLAVIGREFSLSLIRQVIAQPEDELYRLLASLQRKEFLYEQPAFPEVEYLFKHALTQEVAYNSVLHERRKVLHEQTARAMEALYHTALDEHYSDLAHHYRCSANTEKAITYLQLAGQQAVQRSAHAEAIAQLTAALDLLLTRPETTERAAQELQLHLSLGPVVMVVQGLVAPAVEQHYTRARALCAQLGDTPQRFPVLYGLSVFRRTRGELRTAQALAEECLQIAEQTNEAGLLIPAYLAVGNACLFRGEFVRARGALAQSVALYQPQHHALTPLYRGFNPQVGSLGIMTTVLWVLGYPEQAQARSCEMLQLAQELGHPVSLAYALINTALLHFLRGEGRVTQEYAEATVALASEHGVAYPLALGTISQGVALIVQEQWAEGINQIRQGLEVFVGENIRPTFLTCLAVGYGGAGQVEEGLAAVAEALRLVKKNDERWYEAEVYRIKGELTLRQSRIQRLASSVEKEAEAYFHKAIEIAQKQQAKSWELRTAMSLSRLWQQQGKIAEAYALLSELYGWFTEGFDTKDLQEAKALLESLT
jgi:tetratricopeptide (TPR) repeat protein